MGQPCEGHNLGQGSSLKPKVIPSLGHKINDEEMMFPDAEPKVPGPEEGIWVP